MTQRLLVRCCCKPTKILGSLPWDGSAELNILAPELGFVRLPVAQMTTVIAAGLDCRNKADKGSRTEISKEIFFDKGGCAEIYRELAYKAEDTPIEVLRRLREFREAPTQLNRFDYVCPYCFGDLRTCPCPNKEKNS